MSMLAKASTIRDHNFSSTSRGLELVSMTPVSRVPSAALYNFNNVFVSAKTTKCNACLECSSLFLKSRSLIFILFSFACTSTSRRALASTSSLTLTTSLLLSNKRQHLLIRSTMLPCCLYFADFSLAYSDATSMSTLVDRMDCAAVTNLSCNSSMVMSL